MGVRMRLMHTDGPSRDGTLLLVKDQLRQPAEFTLVNQVAS